MRVSHRTVATAALIAWMHLGATVAHAEEPGTNAPPPTPSDCSPIYQGSDSGNGQLLELKSKGKLDCRRPGNNAPYGAKAPYTSGDPAADGAHCETLYYA